MVLNRELINLTLKLTEEYKIPIDVFFESDSINLFNQTKKYFPKSYSSEDFRSCAVLFQKYINTIKNDDSPQQFNHAGKIFFSFFPIFKNGYSIGILVVGPYLFTEHDLEKTIISQVIDLLNFQATMPELLEKEIVHHVQFMLSSKTLDKYDLKSWGKKVGYSPKYLGQAFYSYTGKDFQAYRDDLRVRKAKNDLLLTNLPLEEISLSLGFKSPSNFSNFFKRKTDLSPMKFRKKFKKSH